MKNNDSEVAFSEKSLVKSCMPFYVVTGGIVPRDPAQVKTKVELMVLAKT